MKLLSNLILTLLLLTASSGSTRAAAISWNNPSGGNWNVATNWFPGQVPGPGDDVYIYLADSSYAVNINTNTSVSSLTLSHGTLAGTNKLSINGQFTWSYGTIANTGGITLNGTSSLSSTNVYGMEIEGGLLINAGQMTWSGSGNNLHFYGASEFNPDGGTLTNLATGTITIAAREALNKS